MACLTEGIYAYLQEIDGYRSVCLRHHGTAAVQARGDELRVARFFDSRGSAAAHLASAIRQLPRWDECHPGGPGRGRHSKESRSHALNTRHNDPSFLIRCGVVWEHRPLMVQVQRLPAGPFVQVDLLVPPWDGDLPELPLRRLAATLRCHECLIPEAVAKALPPPGHAAGFLGVREYLARVMPPKLYASQCI